jgi:hypothetical protein
VPTRESGAHARRDLRDQLWFRIAIVVALIALIFAASRGCQRGGQDVSQDEAVEIAEGAVDFEPDPDQTQIRLLRQGLSFDSRWFVGLAQTGPDGEPVNATIVEIDAETGEVVSIRRQ